MSGSIIGYYNSKLIANPSECFCNYKKIRYPVVRCIASTKIWPKWAIFVTQLFNICFSTCLSRNPFSGNLVSNDLSSQTAVWTQHYLASSCGGGNENFAGRSGRFRGGHCNKIRRCDVEFIRIVERGLKGESTPRFSVSSLAGSENFAHPMMYWFTFLYCILLFCNISFHTIRMKMNCCWYTFEQGLCCRWTRFTIPGTTVLLSLAKCFRSNTSIWTYLKTLKSFRYKVSWKNIIRFLIFYNSNWIPLHEGFRCLKILFNTFIRSKTFLRGSETIVTEILWFIT